MHCETTRRISLFIRPAFNEESLSNARLLSVKLSVYICLTIINAKRDRNVYGYLLYSTLPYRRVLRGIPRKHHSPYGTYHSFIVITTH